MAEINIKFDVRISQSVLRWGLTALLLAYCAPELASESVTLNTYYPAPSGVYTQMITTANTYLARDNGASTKVGIGNTAPAYKLDVTGDGRYTSNLLVQGSETVSGSETIGGNDTVGGTLSVGSNATIGGNLQVNGSGTINFDLTVGRDESVGRNLTVNQDLTVSRYATFNNMVYANSGIRVYQTVSAAAAYGCSFVSWTSGANQVVCGGYITNQAGFYSQWMSAPSNTGTMNGTDAPGSGEALCCPFGPDGVRF